MEDIGWTGLVECLFHLGVWEHRYLLTCVSVLQSAYSQKYHTDVLSKCTERAQNTRLLAALTCQGLFHFMFYLLSACLLWMITYLAIYWIQYKEKLTQIIDHTTCLSILYQFLQIQFTFYRRQEQSQVCVSMSAVFWQYIQYVWTYGQMCGTKWLTLRCKTCKTICTFRPNKLYLTKLSTVSGQFGLSNPISSPKMTQQQQDNYRHASIQTVC